MRWGANQKAGFETNIAIHRKYEVLLKYAKCKYVVRKPWFKSYDKAYIKILEST
jgi:hypothetical protein